jgi:hypothetical protein
MGEILKFPEVEKISEWVCPVCGQNLLLDPFKSNEEKPPSKRGFLLRCKGSDSIPHALRIYLQGFREDAPFLPSPTVSKKARIQQLLARAKVG